MKRKKIKPKRPGKTNSTKASPQANSPAVPAAGSAVHGRRDTLLALRNWGLLAAVAVGAGWLVIGEVTATIAEHDLSRIGNGTPAVVQIHDPQCSRCLALQRETRDALKAFSSGELQYIVANITTAKGRELAKTHGVQHVTLLLFDGNGKRRSILAGANSSENLIRSFRSHISLFGASGSSS